MKKLLLSILFILLSASQLASAEIRQTENGSVVAAESAFTYKQPVLTSSDNTNNSSADKSTVPKFDDIFSVYVKSTRFYDNKKTHFSALQELDVTSHTKTIDLLFDKKLPPKIEYTKDGRLQTLPLKKITYVNQYFISFKVDPAKLAPLRNAEKVELVFPVITNGSNVGYKKDKQKKLTPIYVKKSLENDSTITYVRYTIPAQIINEWQDALNKDLTPGSITDTLS